MEYALIALGFVLLVALAYAGRGYWAWTTAVAAVLLAWWAAGIASPRAFVAVALVALALAVVLGCRLVRRYVLSAPLMRVVGRILPQIGETERIALNAGTVWWDRELFSGNPDWRKLLKFKPRPLSDKERAFLDGPVEHLCAMLDDWRIVQERRLPDEVWAFIKEKRFLGMIIPEEYGGLGFSALGHSAVVTKIASRSGAVAVVVMVPNSLGPGELLAHYGTEAQKAHYLPRLARGDDIPCFALTEPTAGSDAAATTSTGVVCRGTWQGSEVLGLRLNWEKRYITLAPIATLIGLAFRLLDPDHLLDGEVDRGITCALVPRDLPGIDIGNHHDPMGVPFPNGPIFGRDVFLPLDNVIGGAAGIGQGWRMLMEALAAGRSVSLPSLSVGAAELATRVVGAYGSVREQFNLPIGRFEGVDEAIARIGGQTYLLNAARTLTLGAIDAGEKPAVLTGIVKAYLTESMRNVVNDAMDIQGGAAISRGPKNILGRVYDSIPIGITVEGANILTRTMIVYGQGAIRSHPFVRDEIEAVAARDLARFDRALFGHINFAIQNLVRAIVHALTGGLAITVPATGPAAPYYRRLTRFATLFALISDTALAVYGGSLKRKEKVSGRFADALAWLYIGSATLKRFHDEGGHPRDAAVMRWASEFALAKIETALRGILDNMPNRVLAWTLETIAFSFARRMRGPSDELGSAVTAALLEDGELRRHLTTDIYIPSAQEDGLGRLEATLGKVVATRPVQAKLRAAARSGRIGADAPLDAAVAAGAITADERSAIEEADAARNATIQVDYFAADVYRGLRS